MDSKSLRTLSKGLLRVDSLNILPESSNGNFATGDPRATQSPQLALMHSLFVRLHNFLVELLYYAHPRWNDETLFYEGRRINIAIYQNIVYNEWLPYYLGSLTFSIVSFNIFFMVAFGCNETIFYHFVLYCFLKY